MPTNEWPRETIASLISIGAIAAHKDGNYGSLYPRVEEFGTDGVPFLTAKSLDAGRIDIDGAPRLADSRADSLTFGFVQPEDVLLSHNATIGRVAVVPKFEGRMLVGTSLTYFRLNSEKLRPRYFAAFLAGTDFQNQLVAVMSHSTRNQVPITAQRSLSVVVPPIEVQDMIALTVGQLDDKIEQNRRTGAKLEGLARGVFKAWFVDFEPVKAKAAGATAFPGMPPETFAALPTRFTNPDLGPVPEGWEVMALSECISHLLDHRGKTPKKLGGDWSNSGGTPALSAKNVKAGRIIRTELNNYVDEEMLRRWMPEPLQVNDIVLTSEAPLGELAYLARNADYCLSQRVFGIRANADVIAPSVLYRFLESEGGQSQMRNRATGSTVIGIRQSELRQIEVSVAPAFLQRTASRVLQPIAEQLAQLEEESEKLAALRDYLLPRLLSGRVRVGVTND
jgi:type I restriction enzyme S subunit